MFSNRKLKVFLILLFLMIVLTACRDNIIEDDYEGLKTDVNILSYFPFNEGMFFDYEGEGMEYAAFTREIKHVENQHAQIHDATAGTIIAALYSFEDDRISIVNRQEEFYSDENIIDELMEEEIIDVILKKPLEVGTSWEIGHRYKEIIAIEDEITVPAGTFYDVIKVKTEYIDQDTFTTYDYYAKNIGLILRENIDENYKIVARLQEIRIK
ncbi:TapB family protein [Natronospora cellulosivora (SeqCode)]